MDFRPAKVKICQKLDALRQKLYKMIDTDFLTHMNTLYDQAKRIENKIIVVHYNVDEIINQVDYVKMLLHNEHILLDLDHQLENVIVKKKFIDSVSLKLPSDEFMKYLSLFTYSTELKKLINLKHA